jgi:starch synthase (maltosyl-transferring)
MAYSRISEDGEDVVLVVVTLNPYSVAEATLHLGTEALGLGRSSSFEVYDELSGEGYTWSADPYVRLDPLYRVAHILHVRSQV